jgi:hypothetical protein
MRLGLHLHRRLLHSPGPSPRRRPLLLDLSLRLAPRSFMRRSPRERTVQAKRRIHLPHVAQFDPARLSGPAKSPADVFVYSFFGLVFENATLFPNKYVLETLSVC